MPKTVSKTGSGKQAEFMKTQPRAPCRPNVKDHEEPKKSQGQFAGFKDQIISLNPGLHHLIREE